MNFGKLEEFKKELDKESAGSEKTMADIEGEKFKEKFDQTQSEGKNIGIKELDKMRTESRRETAELLKKTREN